MIKCLKLAPIKNDLHVLQSLYNIIQISGTQPTFSQLSCGTNFVRFQRVRLCSLERFFIGRLQQAKSNSIYQRHATRPQTRKPISMTIMLKCSLECSMLCLYLAPWFRYQDSITALENQFSRNVDKMYCYLCYDTGPPQHFQIRASTCTTKHYTLQILTVSYSKIGLVVFCKLFGSTQQRSYRVSRNSCRIFRGLFLRQK